MTFRPLARQALHWLVIITLIATSFAAPVQAMDSALHPAAAMPAAAAMADTPCGEGMRAADSRDPPCDCCTPASCDLSACLGTACLLEFPRLAAAIPLHMAPASWNVPGRPTQPIATPFRPPIA